MIIHLHQIKGFQPGKVYNHINWVLIQDMINYFQQGKLYRYTFEHTSIKKDSILMFIEQNYCLYNASLAEILITYKFLHGDQKINLQFLANRETNKIIQRDFVRVY